MPTTQNFLTKNGQSYSQHVALKFECLLGYAGSLFVLLVSHICACAAQYEIRGTLRDDLSIPTPIRGSNCTYTFSVSVQDCKWFIEILPLDVGAVKPLVLQGLKLQMVIPTYELASSDGTSFYAVTAFPGTPKQGGNASTAVRGTGSIPFSIDEKLIFLWYTYASHCYFATSSPAKIFPFEHLENSEYHKKDFMVEGYWELLAEPPGLPKFIQTSGYIRFPKLTPPELVADSASLTNTTLRVFAITNVLGATVPTQARIEYFQPARGNKFRSEVYRTLSLTVKTVEKPQLDQVFEPPLPVPSIVQDLNYWARNPPLDVSVVATNGWPVVSSLDLRLAALRMQQHTLTPTSTKSRVISIVFIMLSLFGLLALLAAFRRSKGETQK